MGQAKFERIQEGAYFLIDPSSFQITIISYDPVLANQTILFGWDTSRITEQEQPDMNEQETQGQQNAP